jgi:squalene cyclase
MSVTLQRGANNQVEAVISATAAVLPTGPAIPPSLSPQTSLGGWQEFRIADDTQGITVVSMAGNNALTTPNYVKTTLGRSLTAGTYTLSFTGTNYQKNGVEDFANLQTLAPHEICTATLTAVVR